VVRIFRTRRPEQESLDVYWSSLVSVFGLMVIGAATKFESRRHRSTQNNNQEVVFDVQKASNKDPYNFDDVSNGLASPSFGSTEELASVFSAPANSSSHASQPMFDNARCQFWQDIFLS
jgi:hypothetical protein